MIFKVNRHSTLPEFYARISDSSVLQAVRQNFKPIPLDQRDPARRTPGMFPPGNLPGKVAGIHVAQTRRRSDLRRFHEVFGRRVVRIGHFVILMKSGHMPGDIRRNPGKKPGHLFELFRRIIETGDEERHHFHPEAHAVEPPDRIGHMRPARHPGSGRTHRENSSGPPCKDRPRA